MHSPGPEERFLPRCAAHRSDIRAEGIRPYDKNQDAGLEESMPHMKTALAAATVLGLSSSPVQADAVAYGIVDLAISMDDGGRNGRSYQAKSGLMSASRLGFRGQEELGNGFRALFHLELGFAADTGVQNSYAPAGATAPSVGWNRKAYVGAAHERWGTLLLGRNNTPFFHAAMATDALSFGLYGSNIFLTTLTGSPENVRIAGNGVYYLSPAWGGLSFNAVATTGAERPTSPRDERRLLGLGMQYERGGLLLAAAYQSDHVPMPGGAQTGKREDHILGGRYDFGGYSLSAGYAAVKMPTQTADRHALWLGGSVSVGRGKILAQFSQTRSEAPAGVKDGKARSFGLAYTYSLSRRTTGYLSYGRVWNNATSRLGLQGGSATVAADAPGADPSGLAVGIRHRF